MSDTAAASPASFPAPLRTDGYVAWTWRLYKGSFVPLFFVFFAGAIVTRLLHLAVIAFMTEVLNARAQVGALAVSLASAIMFATLVGSLLSAIASFVFLRRLGGVATSSGEAWRRLRPKLGHAVVGALYVSMPLLTLFLFLGPLVPYILLPAALGPPVIAQAIVWEHLEFRPAATRAKNLIAGNGGRVASVVLMIALGGGLLSYVVDQMGGRAIVESTDATIATSIWLGLLGAATSAAVWLLTAAASTVAYLDLRSRFEDLGADDLAAEAVERTI